MIIKLCAKCSDCCCLELVDNDNICIIDHDGYVPHMPGLGSGDYVEVDVDLETGQILGWDAEKVKAGLRETWRKQQEELKPPF